MKREDYEVAKNYWKNYEMESIKMEEKDLLLKIEEYIKTKDTCVLATSSNDVPRCTPIEYHYHKGCFWIVSEGGEKFSNLEKNKKVGIGIFNDFSGFNKLKGLQIEGVAEIIDFDDEVYKEELKVKGISIEALEKRGTRLYLIKITPLEMNFVSSELKKEGFDPRQKIRF